MGEDGKEEEDKYNFGSTPTFEQSQLYCLTFESFSPLESSLLNLARPESSQPREVKRSLVSLVASAIALIDICNLFREMEDTNLDARIGSHDTDDTNSNTRIRKHESNVVNQDARIESHDTVYANQDARIESPVSLGGGGGFNEPPSSVSGCLPHSNSPQKISNYSEIGKRIHTMLSSLSRIELSEEEWLDSYELHVNNRKSKNPLSDRHVRF